MLHLTQARDINKIKETLRYDKCITKFMKN